MELNYDYMKPLREKMWEMQRLRLMARVAQYQAHVIEASQELTKLKETVARIFGFKARLDGDKSEEKRQFDDLKTHILDGQKLARELKSSLQESASYLAEYQQEMDALAPSELWDKYSLEMFTKIYGENAERAERLHREAVGIDMEIRFAMGEDGKAVREMIGELIALKSRLLTMRQKFSGEL